MSKDKPKTVKRIKTSGLERRLSIAGTSMVVGTRAATHLWANALMPKQTRLRRRKKMVAEQAEYLADELGKLKGSVVKIGQVMALYGEHILPDEVTSAFRKLEEQTIAVHWPVIERALEDELGPERMAALDVDPETIGAASLGQVHRAVRKSDGKEICLKIQYPGVADAVDNDLNAVAQILRWTKMVTLGKDFDDWLEEVREMLHREVDYVLEAETTEKFRNALEGDKRFVVPEVDYEFSTPKVLATSYEPGWVVNGPDVLAMAQSDRDDIGRAFLDLFFKEIFQWGELQTDPNFGNYRIRPASSTRDGPELVLLDFGAVKAYEDDFLEPLKSIVIGAYHRDFDTVKEGALAFGVMLPEFPDEVQLSFAEVCMALVEPLNYKAEDLPNGAVNEEGDYRWAHSELPKRVAKQAAKSAVTKHFTLPPKEFTFMSRKLLGVYSFISALDAEFNGRDIAASYIDKKG